MSDPKVSHGRGGAANIHKDDTEYVDGAIIRQGEVGDQGNGPYSAGRGGRGNIESAGKKAATQVAGDKDIVPQQAIRMGNTTDYHVGRGGEGNRRNSNKDDPIPGHEEGLAEKLKNKLKKKVGKEDESGKEDDKAVEDK